jgi:hypothetical protein
MQFRLFLLLLLGVCLTSKAQEQGTPCFAIHLIKDGKLVDPPPLVTFLDQSSKRDAAMQDGRFCIPREMAAEGALDLSFVLGKEKFYFPRVPMDRFGATWDVSFGNKKNPRLASLPKTVDTKKACSVIVHQGEPEVGTIYSPCRFPARAPIK